MSCLIRSMKYDDPDPKRFAHRKFTVQVNDPEGAEVFKQELTTEEFGGLSGAYALPDGVAIVAVAIFTNVPAVLGHAGLMTTDLAVTATLPLALYALDRVLTGARGSVLLGIAVGLGVLSKLTFIVYFSLCAAALVGMGLGALNEWIGCRHRFLPVHSLERRRKSPARTRLLQ